VTRRRQADSTCGGGYTFPRLCHHGPYLVASSRHDPTGPAASTENSPFSAGRRAVGELHGHKGCLPEVPRCGSPSHHHPRPCRKRLVRSWSRAAIESMDARAQVDELIERSRKEARPLPPTVRQEGVPPAGLHGCDHIEELSKAGGAFLSRTAGCRPGGHSGRQKCAHQATKAGQEGPGKKSRGEKSAAKKGSGEKGSGPRRPRRRRLRRKRPPPRRAGRDRGEEARSRRVPPRRLRPPVPGRPLTRSPKAAPRPALVERGLAETGPKLVALIETGRGGLGPRWPTKRPGWVAADEPIELSGPPPAVRRTRRRKLHAALDRFTIDPAGLRALDAGASTGGSPTACCSRGVIGVLFDVGHGNSTSDLAR